MDLSPTERIKRLKELELEKKKELEEIEKKKKEEFAETQELIKKTIEDLTQEEEQQFRETEDRTRKKEKGDEENLTAKVDESEEKRTLPKQISYTESFEAIMQGQASLYDLANRATYNKIKELVEKAGNQELTNNEVNFVYKLKEQIHEAAHDQYMLQKDTNDYITRTEDVLKLLERKMRNR